MATESKAPLTPVRSPRGAMIHDSPYSDYFTDEARSVDGSLRDSNMHGKTGYSMPSPEAQRLLLRLNNLGAQILRQGDEGKELGNLNRKLDLLERALSETNAGESEVDRMRDSGLYMEDSLPDLFSADTTTSSPIKRSRTANSTMALTLDGAVDSAMDRATYVQTLRKSKDQGRLLDLAQDVLERITKANCDLQRRFEEMKELNDQYSLQAEDSAREALRLKSENESLKSTLAFDHSELLFLQLQLKAFEVQLDSQMINPDESAEQREHRLELEENMRRWKTDSDDVDARQRIRRQNHRVLSSSPMTIKAAREDGKDRDETGEWTLDMRSKKNQGRVHSITIRRFEGPRLGLDGAADEEIRTDDEEEEEGNTTVMAATDEEKHNSLDAKLALHTQTVCEIEPIEPAKPATLSTTTRTIYEAEPTRATETETANLTMQTRSLCNIKPIEAEKKKLGFQTRTICDMGPTCQTASEEDTDDVAIYSSGEEDEEEEGEKEEPEKKPRSLGGWLWEELEAMVGMSEGTTD
ncbi:hypothetical protein MBLNU457_g2468t1 [Dothideomycetes sp. NU457]